MPRKFIRRWLPNDETFRRHPRLRFLGTLLQNANIWHLNRGSVSGGVSVGLFTAWVPVPVQMVLAALAAILLRVNLPISVVLVWVTNPVTIPPLYYFAYKLGTWILRIPTQPVHFELSLVWMKTQLLEIWEPLLLGCLVLAILSALSGNLAVRLLWRMHVLRNWRLRRERRRARGVPSK